MKRIIISFALFLVVPLHAMEGSVVKKIALVLPKPTASVLAGIEEEFLKDKAPSWQVTPCHLTLKTNDNSAICDVIVLQGNYDLIVTMGGKCLEEIVQACVAAGRKIPIVACEPGNTFKALGVPDDYPVTGIVEGSNLTAHLRALKGAGTSLNKVIILHSEYVAPYFDPEKSLSQDVVDSWQQILSKNKIAYTSVLIDATAPNIWGEIKSKVEPLLPQAGVVLMLKDHILSAYASHVFELCNGNMDAVLCASDGYSFDQGHAHVAYGVPSVDFSTSLMWLIKDVFDQKVAPHTIRDVSELVEMMKRHD